MAVSSASRQDSGKARVLSRDFSPVFKATSRFGRLRRPAKKAASSALAFPSSGAAAIRTLSRPSLTHTRHDLDAPGCTLRSTSKLSPETRIQVSIHNSICQYAKKMKMPGNRRESTRIFAVSRDLIRRIAGKKSGRAAGPPSRYRGRGFFHFINESRFKAYIKKVSAQALFNYLFITVVYPGNADNVAIVIFIDDIQIFNPARFTFDTVTFHG
jgi:hypothetical protein